MPYTINHVHIRSQDPHKSAEWYTKYFGAGLYPNEPSCRGRSPWAWNWKVPAA